MDEFIQKLKQIEEKLDHVSNQMQELRDAVRESSNQNQKLPVPEPYEHPWYKFKRQQLIISGDSERDGSEKEEISFNL